MSNWHYFNVSRLPSDVAFVLNGNLVTERFSSHHGCDASAFRDYCMACVEIQRALEALLKDRGGVMLEELRKFDFRFEFIRVHEHDRMMIVYAQ